MKVTLENIDSIPTLKKDWDKMRLRSLVLDVERINTYGNRAEIYIDWQDFHNEYSPERTDPCPDYYGLYTLRSSKNRELIGFEMDLDTLEDSLGVLENFIVDEFGDLELE